ncbi:hypothetical protein [Nocardioides guangzhouensis]|uniref:hypothetical protein n=1 Tax=Nocardioides guangzhouensis TaxID=2497878 RepID=UPI001C377CCC|nr:hypothetical protein [Nocardioides guangzhouensis]
MTAPRIAVDPWDPSYGTPTGEAGLQESTARLTIDFELPGDRWKPLDPPSSTWRPEEVLIVDGIRRVDARVWFMVDGEPAPNLGLAASYAAGVVRINGRAQLSQAEVRRAILTACPEAEEIRAPLTSYPIIQSAGADPDALSLTLQQQMRDLELLVAHSTRSSDDDLLLLDGPLRGRTTIPRTVGYIKTHHAMYLPTELNAVVADLRPGQRTPVFTIGTTWSRHTWYIKLPVVSDMPWAGVVRCECADSLPRDEAFRLADATTALLPGLASRAHKDPRAPQNLTPIGGLEKLLRHRLGDPAKLHRGLVVATRGDS